MRNMIDDAILLIVTVFSVIGMLAIPGLTFYAWVIHVITCINTASYLLLVIGIIVPPIGWVHGFAIWFGVM